MAKGKVKILEVHDNRIVVLSQGYPLSLMNALRRVILSDVPTMAVDFAYFYDNNTGVYDEMIAHRLGLLPLASDEALGRYKPGEECKGREPPDPECFVELVLEREVREEEQGVYVKASELVSSDPAVKPVYPGTPITYIGPGQRLHLIAYARLGRGREHGKWSPASVSVLQYLPVVEYDGSKVSEECLKCISYYDEVVRAVRSGRRGRVELMGNVNTSGLRYCVESSCRGSIRLWYDDSRLILTVESTGALRPERIIVEATRVLEETLASLKEELEAVEVVQG